MTSGYRAANKDVIRFFVRNYPADYPEPESLVRLCRNGFRVREVPANMFPRKEGKSSIGALQSVYYMLKVTLSILYASTWKEEKKTGEAKEKTETKKTETEKTETEKMGGAKGGQERS